MLFLNLDAHEAPPHTYSGNACCPAAHKRVDYYAIRRFRELGHSVRESVLLGGRQRLRAIVMTSLTTVTGVVPLMFGIGGGGALYRPLAAAVIGGAISSILVTFFVLPVAYTMLEERKERSAAPVTVPSSAELFGAASPRLKEPA